MTDYARKLIGCDSLTDADQRNGAGEIVGIIDSGIDATHPDLQERVTVSAVDGGSEVDKVGHGTHVAGTIAGDGTASGGKLRGMAPGAHLSVLGIVGDDGHLLLPPDVGDLLRQVAATGAKIINLSWGTPIASVYENGAMAIDTFARQHPDVLVVIAAGNEGTAPHGEPSLYTIGTPATAKNGISVGACCSTRPDFATETWKTYQPAKFPQPPIGDLTLTGNPDLPAAFSSRGPTDSDSLGPDLLAPGTAILAARAAGVPDRFFWRACPRYDGHYAFNNGTSMAAPVVSGAAAIIRQYLRGNGAAAPSAALLKAVLISAADRLPWSRLPTQEEDFGYPDFDQGHGRLNLCSVLPSKEAPIDRRLSFQDVPNDSDDALESRAPAGSIHKAVRAYRLRVKEGAATPLRIVLCWSDYSVRAIQNGLSLNVQCPDATQLVGNPGHRWLTPKGEYLELGGRAAFPDRRNNVQRVDVNTPPPGVYRIRVLAENTLFPPQGYALVVSGELADDLEEEPS